MSTTTTRPPETPSAAPARSRRAAAAASVRRALPAAGILVAIALIWEAVSHWFGVPDYVLPSLDRIWRTGVSSWSGTLASATWVTTKEVLLGFLLAVVVALALAFALHSSRTVRNAVYPLLIGSQAVPIVVIAPVLAIIFGYTITPKLIVVALICFFPIVVNTIDGLASVDPDLLKVMRTLDGNRWATLRRVEAPAALPSMFSGLRIAATYAPIGAVFGEYAGSQNGLGYVMIQAIPQLETDLVFAAIFILTFEAILLFIAVSVLERITCPWAREGKR
ncbi:MAG TPA: ABC transporter permease [Streptosporangiaceae bacterium]|jgi:putative hydroxymethylpyrimidine transport system permease protein|nr:ABC transporter permease [Streptosporangiaceae bacterium]